MVGFYAVVDENWSLDDISRVFVVKAANPKEAVIKCTMAHLGSSIGSGEVTWTVSVLRFVGKQAVKWDEKGFPEFGDLK